MDYTASSLWSAIQSGNNILTSDPSRSEWLAVMSGQASLEPDCNMVGFNLRSTDPTVTNNAVVRIGIVANQENDCATPDSFIGFGGMYRAYGISVAAGGYCAYVCDNGGGPTSAFGYVLAR